MLIVPHKNAHTTPAVRAETAASGENTSVLAKRYGITEQTVYRWNKRESFSDRSHTAHRLQTVLTPAQESIVIELRRILLLRLDDLLAVTRSFSALIYLSRVWIAVYTDMELAISTPSRPRRRMCRTKLQKLCARLPAHGREISAVNA